MPAGSRPMSAGTTWSVRYDATASSRPFSVASPRPWRPSSVSTFRVTVTVEWSGHLTTSITRRYDASTGRGPAVPRLCRSPALPLQLVEQKRLYRQIADQLAQLIARGEFPAGARLPAERELAASFGVSRASVREAIISLEMTGLVEVRVGTGIFVAPQPESAARPGADAGPGPFELLAARKLVEGEIAAQAARHAAPAQAEALRRDV